MIVLFLNSERQRMHARDGDTGMRRSCGFEGREQKVGPACLQTPRVARTLSPGMLGEDKSETWGLKTCKLKPTFRTINQSFPRLNVSKFLNVRAPNIKQFLALPPRAKLPISLPGSPTLQHRWAIESLDS